MTRRTAVGALLAAPAIRTGRGSPNEKLVVACIGVRGRAGTLMRGFAEMTGVEIATLCDIDSRLFKQAVADVAARQKKEPRTLGDFRRLLDDKSIDVVVIGTPDHWHALPAIFACQAGKHVYVEKPASHNFREGQVMLAAARRYKRVMQVGIQSRSGAHFAEAIDYIRTGALGKAVFARAWETAVQRAMPARPDEPVPAGVDYEMWLGPAPQRAFNPNHFHSSWRWFFDYGTGDLGNDGVHRLDYAIRGLEAAMAAQGQTLAEWPVSVSAAGGKHYFDDAQEWPDTLVATWEFGPAMLTYEMRIWAPNPMEGEEEGAAIYGDQGYVLIGNTRWQAYGPKGEKGPGGSSTVAQHDPAHKRNFFECIRNGGTPACDIAAGHRTSALTHFGNIAWRVNRKLHFHVASQSFRDPEADRLLGRTYRKPWSLPAV